MKKTGICKKIILVIFFISSLLTAHAQSDIGIDLGADLVSSYVWRGIRQTGISVQPTLGVHYKGFSLSAWGSTDFKSDNDGNSSFKEVDFTAAYEANGLKIALTDYWWDGSGTYHYFRGAEDGYSGHLLEGTIGYTFPEQFPLSLTWNTFFLGKGNKKGTDQKNSFSTFIEAEYPFAVKDIVDMSVAVGVSPWESPIYRNSGFAVTQVKLHAEKGIRFSDSFTLPIFADVIFNTNKHEEDVNFVFGLSLNIQ